MFGDRITRSWLIAKQSWAVLRGNPALGVFPILSALFTVIASIPFGIAIYLASPSMASGHSISRQDFGPAHYALMFLGYFVDYFIVIFFNSALVACAYANLNGQPTTVNYGLQQALQRLPQILGWTLIAATVGTILRVIAERFGTIGSIATGIIGLAWNIAVFFVVPGLVIERLSPSAALKESVVMLKQSWGERLILGIGVGAVSGLFFMLGLIPMAISVIALVNDQIWLGLSFMGLAVFYWLLLAAVFSSLGVIFQTALYMYCRTGQTPGGFSQDAFQYAFQPKPQRRIFGQ